MIDVVLAEGLGRNAERSFILEKICRWSFTNQKKGSNNFDGHYWVYNTLENWAAELPYKPAKSIYNYLRYLRENEFIFTGNYNKHKWDRTVWYAPNWDKLDDKFPHLKLKIHGSKLDDAISNLENGSRNLENGCRNLENGELNEEKGCRNLRNDHNRLTNREHNKLTNILTNIDNAQAREGQTSKPKKKRIKKETKPKLKEWEQNSRWRKLYETLSEIEEFKREYCVNVYNKFFEECSERYSLTASEMEKAAFDLVNWNEGQGKPIKSFKGKLNTFFSNAEKWRNQDAQKYGTGEKIITEGPRANFQTATDDLPF